MTITEEKQLIKLAQSKNRIAAEAAMETLLASNEGLIKSIANKFKRYDIEFEDLCILGQRGLIKAIINYDLKSTNKLCTYAYYEIYQHMQKGLDEINTIYVPSRQLKLYWSIVSFKKDYYNTHGYYPSVQEIAKGLKVSKQHILKNARVINQVYSLDKTIDPNQRQTSASMVSDDRPDPNQIAIEDEALEQLYACLKKSLSEKQYQVISWTYGLDKSTGRLEAKEIAKRLHLSVPAVRKIQYGTLDLLRQVKEMAIINESL